MGFLCSIFLIVEFLWAFFAGSFCIVHFQSLDLISQMKFITSVT